MAAVVGLHCVCGFAILAGVNSERFLAGLGQPFKFGTIGFFLISGFLMGEGLQRRSPVNYLSRRVRTILAPWTVWFVSFIVLKLVWWFAKYPGLFCSFERRASFAMRTFHFCLFETAFWFVPNLLFAVSLVVFCRRFLDDLRFGYLLLAISLFYGLNIHAGWISLQSHTEALFGFAFYLWLGAWSARHRAALDRWLSSLSISKLVAVAGLTGLAGFGESSRIVLTGTTDAMNTLRISNQLYSVAVVLLIYKAKGQITPRFIDARSSTFGIYLSHTLVMSVLMSMSFHLHLPEFFGRPGRDYPAVASVYVLCGFLMTYFISLLLTRLLLTSRYLGWTVGGAAVRSRQSDLRPTPS